MKIDLNNCLTGHDLLNFINFCIITAFCVPFTLCLGFGITAAFFYAIFLCFKACGMADFEESDSESDEDISDEERN